MMHGRIQNGNKALSMISPADEAGRRVNQSRAGAWPAREPNDRTRCCASGKAPARSGYGDRFRLAYRDEIAGKMRLADFQRLALDVERLEKVAVDLAGEVQSFFSSRKEL
jgi:hypothetical protein